MTGQSIPRKGVGEARCLLAANWEAAYSEGLGGVLLEGQNNGRGVEQAGSRLDRLGDGGVGGLGHESQRQQEQHNGDDSAHLGRRWFCRATNGNWSVG